MSEKKRYRIQWTNPNPDKRNWSMQLNLMNIARQGWDGTEFYWWAYLYEKGEKFKFRLTAVRYSGGENKGEWFCEWWEMRDIKLNKLVKWVRWYGTKWGGKVI